VFTCSPKDATLAGAVGGQGGVLIKLYIRLDVCCIIIIHDVHIVRRRILTSRIRTLVHPKTRLPFANHGRSGHPKLVPLKFLEPPHLNLRILVAEYDFLLNDLETIIGILCISYYTQPTHDLSTVYLIVFYVHGVLDNHAVRPFRLHPRHEYATGRHRQCFHVVRRPGNCNRQYVLKLII